MPTPHRDTSNMDAFRELSALSVRERLDQLQSTLTEAELAFVEGNLINWCGMDLAKMSFFDCMRWWANAGYKADGIENCSFTYKLACGQTGLARAMFEDVTSYPNFGYAFQSPVTRILWSGASKVSVTTAQGDRYTARHLISTIPWNVLDSISFEPPLPEGKRACFKNVSMGNSTKVYAEVNGSDWDAWGFLSPSSELTNGIQWMGSIGCTPAGNARMVIFSLRDHKNRELFPDEDPEATMAALKKVNPQMVIKRLASAPSNIVEPINANKETQLFHNWTTDPYTKGVWVMFRTGEAEKALPVLRESVDNIHFASADWAQGWRGFVEGAVEQGLRASVNVHQLLCNRLTASI